MVSTPAIAPGPEGATYLVWEEKNSDGYMLFSSYRPAKGDWEPRMPIPGAAGNRAPAGPALAIDAGGAAYVTWVDTRSESPVVRFAMAAR